MPDTPLHSVHSTRLIVGMEIHVELATRSKMFSRAPNVAHPDYWDAEPNTLVDPVVMALPGALPVMNKAAVELSMKVGLALNCRIADFSRWDRKNYFYPDLPKGYQISQYDLPLCADGYLDIPIGDGETKRINILRAHLEEDAGKLSHELPGGGHYDGTLIDLNRAGTPLLEIVTYPDFTTADEAGTFAQELRNLCRFLGVTEAVMQRGHMRFEPNINVEITDDEGRLFTTPIVEVKNLNSFRSLRGAIEYEAARQVEVWLKDGAEHGPGQKSTRGWDDDRCLTFEQRSKEDAHDYRYFRDPDLPPVVVDEAWRKSIEDSLPELPAQRRERYREVYDLDHKAAFALTADRETCEFYEACIEAMFARQRSRVPQLHAGRSSANWLLNAGARLANERECGVHELGITPAQIAELIELRDDNEIGSSAADRLFELLCSPLPPGERLGVRANPPKRPDTDVRALAQKHNLLQVTDTDQLDEWIAEALEREQQAAADYAAGKDAALGRLTGAVMRISNGRADAAAVQATLREKLRE